MRILGLVVVLWAASTPERASAQCVKDLDCDGGNVCVQGECVTPSPQPMVAALGAEAAPRVSPQGDVAALTLYIGQAPRHRSAVDAENLRDEWWRRSAKKNVLAFNPLPLVEAAFLGSPGSFATLAELEFITAPTRRLSLYAQVSPTFIMQPDGYDLSVGLGAGARFHFFGDAPGGLWLGGGAGVSTITGSYAFEVRGMLGYGIVAGSLYFAPSMGLALTLNPVAPAPPLNFTLQLPIGFAF